MSRLIAVSNRTAADHKARAGGLAVAVWEALCSTGGLWLGWSGEVTTDDTRGARMFTDEGVDFALADLTHAEYDGFYMGYANRALWPVMHYRNDLAVFQDSEFQVYEAVNRKFAKLLAPRVRPGDKIWVHDYHFFLFGEAMRQEGWTGPMGYFLHIPFPAPELFAALPEHQRLARALTAYDLVGLQTEGYRANFERYLIEYCGGVRGPDGAIAVFDTQVQVRAYPIGIDVEDFAKVATGPVGAEAASRIQRFLGDRKFIIGIDRMDYSKGMPERFQAMGKLLDTHPELQGAFSFTQIAPPSRSKVEEYADLRIQLDELAGRINGDYGDLDWIPLRYLVRTYSRDELAGLTRMAHVGLVTPLRDGMNLVAKEYIAAQDPEDPGVLVLSEFAGAADQLREALLVNPYDTTAVADAIAMALQMPLAERKDRWRTLYQTIADTDVRWWRTSFLDDLERYSTPRTPA